MSFKYEGLTFIDSFGYVGTALAGVTTYTLREIRSTGIVLPHIALNDVFSYTIQFNHNKRKDRNIHDFHIHIMPVGTTTGTTTLTWAWGWYAIGQTLTGATLPNTGTTVITIPPSSQYKHLYFDIIEDLTRNNDEAYSSFLFVKVVRSLNVDYTDEFALLGADCHYITDREGSFRDTSD